MRMAAVAGVEVPAHGLLRAVDDSWVYFVKRYDRVGRSGRVYAEILEERVARLKLGECKS